MNTTVKNLFTRFCEAYNLRTRADVTLKSDNPAQSDFYSHSFIRMDYNPHYGGYRMDIVHTGTSEGFFDGSSRMTAKEMNAYLKGLIAARSEYCFKGIVKETK